MGFRSRDLGCLALQHRLNGKEAPDGYIARGWRGARPPPRAALTEQERPPAAYTLNTETRIGVPMLSLCSLSTLPLPTLPLRLGTCRPTVIGGASDDSFVPGERRASRRRNQARLWPTSFPLSSLPHCAAPGCHLLAHRCEAQFGQPQVQGGAADIWRR
jgi:hypothetical protein